MFLIVIETQIVICLSIRIFVWSNGLCLSVCNQKVNESLKFWKSGLILEFCSSDGKAPSLKQLIVDGQCLSRLLL